MLMKSLIQNSFDEEYLDQLNKLNEDEKRERWCYLGSKKFFDLTQDERHGRYDLYWILFLEIP